MYKLSIILLAILNSEDVNSIDFIIAKFILDHVDNLAHISMKSLSEECHVSKASISRFCRKIGLDDFMELRQELYKVRFYRDEQFNWQLNSGDRSYVMLVAMQLVKLHQFLDYGQIRKLASDIYRFPRVTVVGHMQSQAAATNLQENLFVSRKIAVSPSLFGDQLSYFKQCSKDDLIIVFSNEGLFFERIFDRKLQINELREPKIYVITSHAEVSEFNYYNEVVLVPDNDDFVSHPMQFMAVSNIIAIAYAQYCREMES